MGLQVKGVKEEHRCYLSLGPRHLYDALPS